MRSLHPADAVHKGFETIPTSILQRKNGVCIYGRPACRFLAFSFRTSPQPLVAQRKIEAASLARKATSIRPV